MDFVSRLPAIPAPQTSGGPGLPRGSLRFHCNETPVRTVLPWGEMLIGRCRVGAGVGRYSTVTLFARLRGLSTSQPRRTAMW